MVAFLFIHLLSPILHLAAAMKTAAHIPGVACWCQGVDKTDLFSKNVVVVYFDQSGSSRDTCSEIGLGFTPLRHEWLPGGICLSKALKTYNAITSLGKEWRTGKEADKPDSLEKKRLTRQMHGRINCL